MVSPLVRARDRAANLISRRKVGSPSVMDFSSTYNLDGLTPSRAGQLVTVRLPLLVGRLFLAAADGLHTTAMRALDRSPRHAVPGSRWRRRPSPGRAPRSRRTSAGPWR